MKTTEQFILESKGIFGDKYFYHNTSYTGCVSLLIITCPIHGDFKIKPNNHLSQHQGCQKCSKRHKPTLQEFIHKSNKIHNNKFDYSTSKYVNNKTKIEIICQDHGSFFQTPTDHIDKRSGCPICARLTKGEYHKKDTNWFIEQANIIHSNQYDYSKVNYVRYHDKVEIICHKHGSFWQTAGSHIHNKNGCPKCSYEKREGGYCEDWFNKYSHRLNLDGRLYLIKIYNETESFIKIGITQKTISNRFNNSRMMPYNYDVIREYNLLLYHAYIREQDIKSKFIEHHHYPKILFDGFTECFDVNALPNILAHMDQQERSVYK